MLDLTGKNGKFSLGKFHITPGAFEALTAFEKVQLLIRHHTGDWGDLVEDDKQLNEDALIYGGRIFSSYIVDDVKFWVITEADRSVTTILLPEEY